MSLSLRCAVCREEFVTVESYDDDPLCLRCHQEIQRRVAARIAELEAEREAFAALAKGVLDVCEAELHAVRQALAHPAVQRTLRK